MPLACDQTIGNLIQSMFFVDIGDIVTGRVCSDFLRLSGQLVQGILLVVGQWSGDIFSNQSQFDT